MAKNLNEPDHGKAILPDKKIQRRQFLQLAGATALTATVLSCKRNEITDPTIPSANTDNTIDFSSDRGILNYIYALEQLTAAFYVKVNEALPTGLADVQKTYLNEIRLHELTHAEYFKRFIGLQLAIGSLEFDFSSIDFTSKDAVLATAKNFEDLGVAAYNGAMAKASETATLIALSTVVSVEARHATWIRNQVTIRTAVNIEELSELGASATDVLDASLSPAAVLPLVSKYIKTKLNIINL